MRTHYNLRYPIALTIAGSDSGGGAGIQADLKTFSSLGVYGASAITAVTAQNTLGVENIQAISPEIVESQIDAVMQDFQVDAVKIGMLFLPETVRVVAQAIKHFSPSHVILDPVMISTSGSKLIEDETIEVLVSELFHCVHLITPNTDEATFLTGIPIRDEEDTGMAAERLLAMGCPAVLMKGGHLQGETITDTLYIKGVEPLRLTAPAIDTINTHGTGCTLSSAITAYLALGYTLPEAVKSAKIYITKALQAGADVQVGHGNGSLNHFFNPQPLVKIKR